MESSSQRGLTCCRTFPLYGSVSWGGADAGLLRRRRERWKYVPVRRTAVLLEESLFGGTKWVVFDPNDESRRAISTRAS